MPIHRRKFLHCLIGIIAAPAVVRIENIMAIAPQAFNHGRVLHLPQTMNWREYNQIVDPHKLQMITDMLTQSNEIYDSYPKFPGLDLTHATNRRTIDLGHNSATIGDQDDRVTDDSQPKLLGETKL